MKSKLNVVRKSMIRRGTDGKFRSANVRCPKCGSKCNSGPVYERVGYWYCMNPECRQSVKIDRVLRISTS